MYNSTIQELKKRKNRYIIIPMKKGSWLKPAERRLTGFDPQPDLDNANVGKYMSCTIMLCVFCSLFFCELGAPLFAEQTRRRMILVLYHSALFLFLIC